MYVFLDFTISTPTPAHVRVKNSIHNLQNNQTNRNKNDQNVCVFFFFFFGFCFKNLGSPFGFPT